MVATLPPGIGTGTEATTLLREGITGIGTGAETGRGIPLPGEAKRKRDVTAVVPMSDQATRVTTTVDAGPENVLWNVPRKNAHWVREMSRWIPMRNILRNIPHVQERKNAVRTETARRRRSLREEQKTRPGKRKKPGRRKRRR